MGVIPPPLYLSVHAAGMPRHGGQLGRGKSGRSALDKILYGLIRPLDMCEKVLYYGLRIAVRKVAELRNMWDYALCGLAPCGQIQIIGFEEAGLFTRISRRSKKGQDAYLTSRRQEVLRNTVEEKGGP